MSDCWVNERVAALTPADSIEEETERTGAELPAATAAAILRMPQQRMRLLFVVEGYTDIRFVSLLSEVSDLTILIPREHYRASGLEQRIREMGLHVSIEEIPGSRLAYQLASLRHLWSNANRFDLILGQEMLRGSLSATLVGKIRGVPVVTYMCLPPAEYFRCRRLRRQISWPVAFIGETVIGALMAVNGSLSRQCIALGPYLEQIAGKYSRKVSRGLYYGVDTELYRPCDFDRKMTVRRELGLPGEKFLILFSSRLSHEKDPETVLQSAAIARRKGLDCAVLNLGGEYKKFTELAQSLGIVDSGKWVIARPPAHPMDDLPGYYQSADCLVQASLEEGLGMSPLEALACGIPAVCSSVGGLRANLEGRARLVPVRDSNAMAREFLWIHRNSGLARQQALAGRRYVEERWSRERAFQSLAEGLQSALCQGARTRGGLNRNPRDVN